MSIDAIDAQSLVTPAGKESHATGELAIVTKDVTVDYGPKRALKGTSLSFELGTCTALIGPSGCGKSTYLRCLNLMSREIRGCRIGGEIYYHGTEINQHKIDTFSLRTHVGMVFQQQNPFHKSIYENIAFAPRKHGITKKADLDELVERSLRQAAIWDEVKDKINQSAYALSGGQQQRLCIARTLAMNPDVILMDEPCSALDPIATFAIEETIRDLASKGMCIIIVTHNMEQAMRVSDRTAFFLLGEMVETNDTADLFSNPQDQRLDDYLTGRFG